MGRETRYTYGTNNVPDPDCVSGSSIDLLRREEKDPSAATGWDLVSSYTYNSQHEPLTMTDGAGQTTTYASTLSGAFRR